MTTPLIIAHRGASGNAPENTLAAFRLAAEQHADGIEFDVRLSKEGVPVVFHDHDLRRIAGRQEYVRDLTSQELSAVDVGSWFNRRRRRHADKSFIGEGIPTLQNVLDLLQNFRGRIYVELKSSPSDVGVLSMAVTETIGVSHLLPQMIVKSFRLEAIAAAKRFLPSVKTAALFAPTIKHLKRKREMVDLAREYQADEFSLHFSLASPRMCELAREANMPITIWTTSNRKWIRRSQKRGIAALITNDPAKMLAARD